MKPRFIASIVLPILFVSGLASCSSTDPYVTQGRNRGTVIGGSAGAIIGNNSKLGSWEGAAVGAALGRILGDVAGKSRSVEARRSMNSNPQYNFSGGFP